MYPTQTIMSHSWLLMSFVFLVPSLVATELVGLGQLNGPEDVAYHSGSNLIYMGCADGWIKRVAVGDSAVGSVVENWVNTNGRPLGIAFGHHNEVIVADPKKGLLNITREGEVKVLTVGHEDQKFKLIDAVVVAKDGMVYFTEASYKYDLDYYLLDILEGQPHGRLWSYNPALKSTTLLLSELYFANGLAISPDQDFLIFCETTKKRCRKYYRGGDKKGRAEDFIDLPGFPDNIHPGEKGGHFLISLSWSNDSPNFPFETRFATELLGMNYAAANISTGGVFVVDTNGNLGSQYTAPETSLISSAVEVGNYIYCGSLVNLYLVRLNLKEK